MVQDPLRFVDLGPVSKINPLIAKLQTQMRDTPRRLQFENEADLETQLKESTLLPLSKLLLRPIEPHIRNYKQWTFIPDQQTWLVPWSALITDNGKYVLQEHSVLHRSHARGKWAPIRTIGLNSAVVFGDPDFDHRIAAFQPQESTSPLRQRSLAPKSPLSRLKGFKDALEQLPPSLDRLTSGNVTIFKDTAASENQFWNLKSSSILVMVTHGVFSPDQHYVGLLNSCALALSGANHASTASTHVDGMLTGEEILLAQVAPTVILNECDTAVGTTQEGESTTPLIWLKFITINLSNRVAIRMVDWALLRIESLERYKCAGEEHRHTTYQN